MSFFRFVKTYTPVLFAMIFLMLTVYSCANIASPSGGDYDYDAPKLLKTNPKQNATNVKINKITFDFDENVKLEDQNEKIIITPPQKRMPTIRSANSKVTVMLNDTLIPNTTYTIDFTDAIRDNNEGNTLENFSYSFSTGDYIDSLAVSGVVLQADNLEPLKGVYLGIHSNLSDTAFTSIPFDRISRTNDYGKFTMRGLAPGIYNIFALVDANRDYMYDNPSEAIGFLDVTISPSMAKDTRNDTITTIKGDFEIDSISTVQYNRYLPDDILLRTFTSAFQRQYFAKHERIGNKLSVYFGAPTDMPVLKPLNFNEVEMSKWALMEKSVNNDSISYWMIDSLVSQIDTLQFEMTYLMTDTLNQLVPKVDTLSFVDRTRPAKEREDAQKKKRKRKKNEVEVVDFLKMETNLASTLDVYKKVHFIFEEPLQDDLSQILKFEELVDTTYQALPLKLEVDSLNPRKYYLAHKWEYSKGYRISMDSASIHSRYGKWNDKFDQKIKVRGEDDYGYLALSISGISDSIPAFVELLNASDVPMRVANVKNNVALFKNLNAGTYYARIILDANRNGKWDTGDYAQKLQPEFVYYYNGSFEVKSNWHQEEDWSVDTESIQNMKPLEITKNKPKDKASRKEQMEKSDQNQRRRERRAEEQQRQQTADPTRLNTSTRR